MKRKFEEEIPAEEQEVATEATTEEESAPDSHEQFINILVEMGLSADQAEAVHSMAMDLVNAAGEAPAAEENKEELSAARRRRFARRRAARRNRQEMGYSKKPRRPKRGEFSRRGRSDRNEVVMSRLRAQRKEIVELKKQLAELGQQPAAQQVTRSKSNFQQAEPILGNANAKDRVLNKLKNVL
jgi:hypothetical protein